MTDQNQQSNISFNELAGSVVEGIENEHVPAEAEQEAQHKADEINAEPEKGQVDDHGNAFDPNIHLKDSEGNPKKTKTGKFRKKPGVNKPQSQQSGSGDKDNAQQFGADQAAWMATNMFINTGVGVFGKEWYPQKSGGIDEQAYLQTSFQQYFEAKGVYDIPPGWALAIAMTSYAAPRFRMPDTRTRMQKIGDALKYKIGKMRSKRDATHTDNRQDGQRENDTGKDDRSERA